jgi:hypothetical protein
VPWGSRNLRHYHLEYEEVVLLHQPCIDKLAFKVGVAPSVSGAFTFRAGSGVSLNVSNLLIALPDEFPMPTTASIKFLVGTLITHFLLRQMSSKL